MQHTECLAAVRKTVRETFSALNADRDGNNDTIPMTSIDDRDFEIRESLLLRDEHYCGRRFLANGFQAIWFFEEDEVKFSSPEGATLQVLTASQLEPTPLRRAA